MKLQDLNPKDRIPDQYRNQVIQKLEELNSKIQQIKNSNTDTQNDRRSVYCYEVNWLLGNYKYTDINGTCLMNDIPRIYNLIDKINFWEKFPHNKYRNIYIQNFFLEDIEYYEHLLKTKNEL
jgi:hypothetical protein